MFSFAQYRLSKALARKANARMIFSVMDELRRYNRKKQFENRNTRRIKQIKAENLKILAMKAFKKYTTKTREIKGDLIQERLMEAEEVILDEKNDFEVLNGNVNYEFFTVQSTQV